MSAAVINKNTGLGDWEISKQKEQDV